MWYLRVSVYCYYYYFIIIIFVYTNKGTEVTLSDVYTVGVTHTTPQYSGQNGDLRLLGVNRYTE